MRLVSRMPDRPTRSKPRQDGHDHERRGAKGFRGGRLGEQQLGSRRSRIDQRKHQLGNRRTRTDRWEVLLTLKERLQLRIKPGPAVATNHCRLWVCLAAGGAFLHNGKSIGHHEGNRPRAAGLSRQAATVFSGGSSTAPHLPRCHIAKNMSDRRLCGSGYALAIVPAAAQHVPSCPVGTLVCPLLCRMANDRR